jgi:hypothetical protein
MLMPGTMLQVLSEEPLQGGDLIRKPIAKGLRGIRELTHSATMDCTGYKAHGAAGAAPFSYQEGDACSTILVRGSIPRTQLPCGERPPVQECIPTTPHLCTPSIDPLEPRANCRDASFRMEPVADDDALRLFTDDGAPRLIEKGPLKGALTFTPRNGVTGEARFRISMEKAPVGAGGSGRRLLVAASQPVTREFVISVLPVNDPPVIRTILDLSVVSGSSANFTKVFAPEIIAEVRRYLPVLRCLKPAHMSASLANPSRHSPCQADCLEWFSVQLCDALVCGGQGAGIDNFTWQWSLENITVPPVVFACRQPSATRAQVCPQLSWFQKRISILGYTFVWRSPDCTPGHGQREVGAMR